MKIQPKNVRPNSSLNTVFTVILYLLGVSTANAFSISTNEGKKGLLKHEEKKCLKVFEISKLLLFQLNFSFQLLIFLKANADKPSNRFSKLV